MEPKKYLITVIDQETNETEEFEADELIVIAYKDGQLEEWIRDVTPASIETAIKALREDVKEHLEHYMQIGTVMH